eukprot:TRINITY_DN17273_c0_g1_i1.p1 TRINITY_DN17273_c0_g1~~TRINITY_DN17273_c0_g1_i1.p1  ORF type:complete len:663 (+),score=213.11 TRINITY_DN17273_c0_g1_i1:162-2150(+)
MADGSQHQFGNILLGGRGGFNPGQLRVSEGGFVWKKSGGGKNVDVHRGDISKVAWTRIPKGFQLTIRMKAGSTWKFNGFHEQDVSTLSSFMSGNMGISPEERQLSVNGRNWGEAEVEGNMLAFNVANRQAFEVCIADVSSATTQGQQKNEVVMEFHVDDTAGASEKDALMEMSFHIPNTNTTYVGDEERPSAQVFYEKILEKADVGPSGAEAFAVFEDVHILTPRGRYTVELHGAYLKLLGANDFKIQYTSVVRLFVLPKVNSPQTFVVVTLDPAIRKGQTLYPHVVLQFQSEAITEVALSITDEQLETKYKDRLEAQYRGPEYEVFTNILKGLSDAKVTKPGKFKSNQGFPAVRCSLKADDGFLYPLEKSFFFVPIKPQLILHDEIDYVEFERHGAAGTSGLSSNYFDLLIRLRADTEHQFRNIPRNEFDPMMSFIRSKQMKIMNLNPTAGGATLAVDSDEEGNDPHMARIKRQAQAAAEDDDSDEEDEDFVAGKDDEGSPTEDEDEDGDDDASNASEDESEEEERPAKKRKEAAPVKKKAPPTPKKKKEEAEGSKKDAGKKEKGKKKKKDPNAPKRSLSAYMYFTQDERERMKRENVKLPFAEVGKAVAEKWKNLTPAEKAPFEEKAKVDKVRYQGQMADYKGQKDQPADSDGGEEEDSD